MRVLIAMSGGIDSTAAALLLKEQGHELVGCTFRTRYSTDEQINAAQQLATQLAIPHHVIDLTEVFEQEVVAYFRNEYLAGRTPNPCVVCNRQIKFGLLWQKAQEWGCERLATGHYARLIHTANGVYLTTSADEKKDQTYFLWQVNADQLPHILFPLGDYTKDQIRTYLAAKGFPILAKKTESQDICFIPTGDYRDFLQLPICEGNYVDENGRIVGRHLGFAHYTIGQRKGLGVALGKPAFVKEINAKRNEVMLADHDDLLRVELRCHSAVFRGNPSQPVWTRIRYRSVPTQAQVELLTDGTARVLFSQPVWGVTPGQSVVFYQTKGDASASPLLLVGGGVIK